MTPPTPPGVYRRGLRFLRVRRGALVRLAGWSVLETAQTFCTGYAPARALDDGFLAGDPGVGLAWLGLAALAVLAGAFGAGRVYGAVAALAEPLRDSLVRQVVGRGVREGDRGALSGLTQQVELARDTFAGLVMVSRSFVFTSVGALVGLCSLAPPLLLVVAPPLLLGIGLFVGTLRPLARRQRSFFVADEAIAAHLGMVGGGLRDVTAAGAEQQVGADAAMRVDGELRAALALARWGAVRVAALAVGGQLPVVLLLIAAPWLLHHGIGVGALVGALAYLTQSLLPALQNLVHGLGTSGSRLAVVLDRLVGAGSALGARSRGPASRTGRPTAPSGTPRASAPPLPPAGRAPSSRPAEGEICAPVPRVVPGRPHTPSPALVIRSLSFSYGAAREAVVDGLDLCLWPGEHLTVLGPSGIGKSTLTGLIAGLLEADRGTIEVYGQQVPGPLAAAHRVVIPQEAYVFTGTLAENLGHLRPDPVPEPELLAAADAVGLMEFLTRLGGPAAQIEPSALSAGERQMIALTRAYLSKAPLALLDEATCHLDAVAEERVERAFAQRPGGALLVVAHRTGSARRSDRVLVMDGRQTLCGTHQELLRRSALYRDLVGTSSPTPGRAPAWSEPSLSLRDTNGVDAVASPGLPRDRRQVVAYGPMRQMEVPGDLRDGGTGSGEG